MLVTAALVLSGCTSGPGGGEPAGGGGAAADGDASPSARPAQRPATGDGPAPAVAAPVERPDQPNLVVVMTDDMRVDDLAYMPRTRRLLRRGGVDMRNAFSQFPLCCPARASFLSGQVAHNHRVMWHLAPYGYAAYDDSRTLATSLKDAGYRTGFIGKYLNGYGAMDSKVTGRPSYDYVPAGWDDWRGALEDPGLPGVTGQTYDYYRTPYNINGEVRQDWHGTYQTDVVGDFSLDMATGFARRRDPFFMYVSYVAPHHGLPIEADDPTDVVRDDGVRERFQTPGVAERVRDRFDRRIRKGAGVPRGGGPVEADVSDKGFFWRGLPEPNAAERRALTEVTRQRAESLLVVDQQVGRLVKRLKRLDEWDDTVLVFTSDNGYFLGEHRQRDGKVKAHEPSLRVPMLVAGPGVPEGEKRYDPMTITDLTATLLDLGDADPPHRPDGESRWDSIAGEDRGWTSPVLTEAHKSAGNGAAKARDDGMLPERRFRGFTVDRSSIGVRTPRYSYTRWRYGFTELYDLVDDPLQLENVAGDPLYAADERRLLRTWRRLKDCAGADCRQGLPASLSASPETVRRWGQEYWDAVRRRYG